MGATVLVTGVSTYLGAATAAGLAEDPRVERVIGVDVRTPAAPLGRAEYLRSDVRNPLLGRVLHQREVDTVVHFGAVPTTGSRSARTSAREAAVIGTMQLVALCQSVASITHMVVVSTGSVYGASASSAAVLPESAPVDTRGRAGHVRDALEVETYVQSVVRRRPEVGVTTLRLAPVLGTHTRSSLTDYLRAPVVPVPFGFDARLQVIAEDDATRAVITAALGAPAGVVNVAADGVITLRQALRMAHRPSVPVLTATGRVFGALSRWAGVSGVDQAHIDYMMFGRCMDTTRMRSVLGFHPERSTRQAFEDYAAAVWGVDAHHRLDALDHEALHHAGGARTVDDRPEVTAPAPGLAATDEPSGEGPADAVDVALDDHAVTVAEGEVGNESDPALDTEVVPAGESRTDVGTRPQDDDVDAHDERGQA